ncbi:class I SAM-dependent methyltransferase [Rhodospirillaceae bacterium KN72]|uniref:Class I SAM-dependent methyltransferase n=1 Tax=Pacificispira spongiicola TaxID=2729598 RepID=A0A7Y0DX72_9PROT|nr:SAM-dependent methyltransferase [Pacificispira spongiicola]NMM43255.1 class I SAM-dependent methyltransferase [Pacificispira spongiicola]
MTPLEAHLRRRIAVEGPIPLDTYMGEALGNPAHGYYMTRDPFGRAGDFTTAPEISQMFGELIGLWFAEIWRQMGQPNRFHLVEFGPGRGTLSADLLRAAKRLPGFLDACSLHLVETSPVLREAQRKTLSSSGVTPEWHGDIAELPDDAPLLIVANEFFDALPIRQMQRVEGGWRERLVGIDPNSDALAITLAGGTGPLEALIHPSKRDSAKVGKVVELAPIAWRIAGDLGARLAAQGGAALIIDYGYAGPATGDTLQAVKAHEPCGIFETPGDADLTVHVDFTALAHAATQAGCRAAPLLTQGEFLHRLGIDIRTQTLIQAAPEPMRDGILAARSRLIGEEAMGTLFKVLGLAAPEMPVLPGMEETGTEE